MTAEISPKETATEREVRNRTRQLQRRHPRVASAKLRHYARLELAAERLHAKLMMDAEEGSVDRAVARAWSEAERMVLDYGARIGVQPSPVKAGQGAKTTANPAARFIGRD